MREGCVRQARVVSHRESDLQSAAHFDQNVTVNTVGFAGGIKKLFGCKGALTQLNGQSGAWPASFSTSGWCRVLSLDMRGWYLSGADDQSTLIRLPDKRPKRSNEEFRKVGKEARKFILPAFLPSSFIFCQETG